MHGRVLAGLVGLAYFGAGIAWAQVLPSTPRLQLPRIDPFTVVANGGLPTRDARRGDGPRRPPGQTDLFRARPDTYRPHAGRRGPFDPRFVDGRDFWYGGYAGAPEPERGQAPQPIHVEVNLVAPEPAPAPVPVVVPAAPGPPRTLYVIPHCYAGDTRPRAEQLPRGCRLEDLRERPPTQFDGAATR